MPGTGSPVPAARVLPRLASFVENQFTSLAGSAPACLTPICPKPPLRHSRHAAPWRVFSLRIEKIGLSLGAGFRGSASSPGSLTGKRSTRLSWFSFSRPAFARPRALPRVPERSQCVRKPPSRAGLLPTPAKVARTVPSARLGFRSAPPGGIRRANAWRASPASHDATHSPPPAGA